MNILVRNLPKDVNEGELKALFIPFGKIQSLNLVMDSATGQSKGFGFVDMPNPNEGTAAIKALNSKVFRGQKIRVKTSNARRR